MKLEDFGGGIISPDNLKSPRAQAVYNYLGTAHSLYFEFLECRATERIETLVIQVSVEVSQDRVTDIRSKEPIAISFEKEVDSLPSFTPLRPDFPIDLVHVTFYPDHTFPSLCLWNESFEDLRARLTPYLLLSRLKEWLEKTADGTLDEGDQPLEPVLVGDNDQVILPSDAIDPQKRFIALGTLNVCGQNIISFVEQNSTQKDIPPFVLVPLKTSAIAQRAVHYAPRNLEELRVLLHGIGFDLRAELTKWAQEMQGDQSLLQSRPLLLIEFPKKRTEDGPIESVEYWAFATHQSVTALGEALGAFANASQYGIQAMAVLISSEDTASSEDLAAFSIWALSVRHKPKPESLAHLSGYNEGFRPLIAAVGAGAIGSKVVELSVRCGFGSWSIVDKDILLPHNPVRHVLGDWAIGLPKALALQKFVNSLVPGNPVTNAVAADVKNWSEDSELRDVLESSEVILDMSASVPVARSLAEAPFTQRRISLFLNPSGKDVVILAEDKARTVSLWDLEGSYYRSLSNDDSLYDHLNNEITPARYGNGCRDLTARMSADQVSLLASIAQRRLIHLSQEQSASGSIWRSNLETGEVGVIKISISPGIEVVLGGWRFRWNTELLDDLSLQRSKDLPNETGGVLLGIVDFEHKIVVLAADVPAPPDSIKRPHYFERGLTGLGDAVQRKMQASAFQLKYLGEWHSHPDSISAEPSLQDEEVFLFLKDAFAGTNEIYMMVIVAANELFMRVGFDEKYEEIKIHLSSFKK